MDASVVRHAGVALQALSWLLTGPHSDGRSTFHLLKPAVASGDAASVQRLLAQSSARRRLQSLVDSSRRTLLFYAGSPAVAQLLVQHGCPLDRRDAHGQTPLHCAVIAGRVEVSRWMSERLPQLVHTADSSGKRPMHHAESEAMVRSVTSAHTASARRSSALDAQLKPTHLHCSPRLFAVPPRRVLYEAGGDVNSADKSGSTLMHAAARLGREDVVRYANKTTHAASLAAPMATL